MQCDLLTCQVVIDGNVVKCLIDTSLQLNLLRLSIAKVLYILYKQFIQTLDYIKGVVTTNSGLDPFVGIAQNVPIKVGEVVINTNFCIVVNLIRSAILGSPQCVLVRLAIQYNVFRRITYRIIFPTQGQKYGLYCI